MLLDVKFRQHESGTFPMSYNDEAGWYQLHSSFDGGNSEHGGVDAALLPAVPVLLEPDRLPAPDAPDTPLEPDAPLVP
jgi:hypothetical protein